MPRVGRLTLRMFGRAVRAVCLYFSQNMQIATESLAEDHRRIMFYYLAYYTDRAKSLQ